jgi:hypothetical protein
MRSDLDKPEGVEGTANARYNPGGLAIILAIKQEEIDADT